MFYSDQPIHSSEEDQLGRRSFAKLLAHTLLHLDSEDTFTVGLYGKWGCGKTSLVNMTLEELEALQAQEKAEKHTVVVHFEPWDFTDPNQLLTQFFIRMANEFQKKGDQNLTKIGKALEQYSNAFGLLELLPEFGKPLASVGKWGFSHLGKRIQRGLDVRDVQKQKEQVIRLLRQQPNRVLVVIDDIDRLTNEQIRYIFQLITSVARFPNTAYLLVFDKEIVVEALKGVQSGNGLNYLEKIIQMPIEIPEIQKSDLRKVLFNRLEVIRKDFSEVGFLPNRWQSLFESCVSPYIKHLRDINRLCNTLQFKLTAIASEIDFGDMVALCVLEIHHPLIYEWIKNNKPILTGENDFSVFSRSKSQNDWKEQYAQALQEILKKENFENDAVKGSETLLNALSTLFPHFGQRIGLFYEVYDHHQLVRGNLIALPEKFDRYFQLNVGALAYGTADIRRIIEELPEEQIIDFLFLQEKNGTSYELLMDIMAWLPKLSGERAEVLACAIFHAANRLTKKGGKIFSISTQWYAEHKLLEILDKIPAEKRASFLNKMALNAEPDTACTVAAVINMLELGYGGLAAKGEKRNYPNLLSRNELTLLEDNFSKRIKELLQITSLFVFSNWNIVWYLMEEFEPEYSKQYLNRTVQQEEGLLQFLDHFILTWIGTEIEYQVEAEYTNYFTLQQVLEAIEKSRKNGTFFRFSEELQRKCAAFVLVHEAENKINRVSLKKTEELLESWKAMK